MKDTPSSTPHRDSRSYEPFLPGDDCTWRCSRLGPAQKWPGPLQAYTATVSALAYPAAILWDDDYVLVHNKAWDHAGGLHQQGQSLAHLLTAETKEILYSVKHRKIAKEVQSRDLLQGEAQPSKPASTAILSPLQTSGEDAVNAILVQLLPKPMLYQSLQLGSGGTNKAAEHNAAMGQDYYTLNDVINAADNAPIDEHPFFRRFAEMLPSGLAILDHNAQAVFVNQNFYDLTTIAGESKEFTSWPHSIHTDDYDRVLNLYKEAFKSQRQLRTEFRAKGEPHPWRLLLLTPLGDENLQHVSLREYGGFICSIVDISSEKSSELLERKAAQQARERKEQQERFIDMISHEIRNPLSAVLHCAEDISDAIRDHEQGDVDVPTIREAVETIHLCVMHQKNIVDDVLSFSKLDASLLSLVPKPAEPHRQLQQTLKMFQHEFRKNDVKFTFNVNEPYHNLNVQWVLADLARVSQVLINLITNAIKFTHHAKGEKLIDCSVGASIERPTSYPPDVVFFKSDNLAYKMDATNTTAWGNGEMLYIMVAVRDTGIGISESGQKRLFERFQQATPKTEEVYGGSGLGLNISRKISHLHGGEIGVSSKENEGSTFGFFFKVRRTEAPHDMVEEREGEQEGEDHLRGKIEEIGKKEPQNLDAMESFAWSPGSGDQDEKETNLTSSETAEAETKSAKDKSVNIASPTQEQGQREDAYANAKRSIASKEHRIGGKSGSADVSKPDSSAGSKERPVAGVEGPDGKRTHVLLVEDNIINQRIVYRKLEAKGFNVTTANNGEEAVTAAQNAPRPSSGEKGAFDVILMDQEMPKMDGNVATRAIRELERKGELEHVPILGVTANVRGAQQDEMLESGMDHVLSKPYSIEDMVSTIQKATKYSQGN